MTTETYAPGARPPLTDMICFAIYSAEHAITRLYKPLLAPLGLTYPQYLVLVALWDRDDRTVGDLGKALGLESNTLTPLLKRLESQGFVSRRRAQEDERVVRVTLTDRGARLRAEAPAIGSCIQTATGLDQDELRDLVARLQHVRDHVKTAEILPDTVSPDTVSPDTGDR